MRNPADLSQALQALQRETKNDAEVIHTRELEKKKAGDENFKLAQDDKTYAQLISQEEQKITHLRQQIANDKKKEDENTRLIAKASQEITRLRMESARALSEIQKTQNEYQQALRDSNKPFSSGMKH